MNLEFLKPNSPEEQGYLHAVMQKRWEHINAEQDKLIKERIIELFGEGYLPKLHAHKNLVCVEQGTWKYFFVCEFDKVPAFIIAIQHIFFEPELPGIGGSIISKEIIVSFKHHTNPPSTAISHAAIEAYMAKLLPDIDLHKAAEEMGYKVTDKKNKYCKTTANFAHFIDMSEGIRLYGYWGKFNGTEYDTGRLLSITPTEFTSLIKIFTTNHQ